MQLISIKQAGLIESDHFPPKASYKYAKMDALGNKIRMISQRNMAAVSLRFEHHRQFITTGSSKKAQKLMRDLFEAGNYFEAISVNIGWYRSNPDRQGEARDRFDQYIKQGVRDALEIHVKNGLIDQKQRELLIQRHQLDVTNPTLNNILNLPLRNEAREYLLNDIGRYKPTQSLFFLNNI